MEQPQERSMAQLCMKTFHMWKTGRPMMTPLNGGMGNEALVEFKDWADKYNTLLLPGSDRIGWSKARVVLTNRKLFTPWAGPDGTKGLFFKQPPHPSSPVPWAARLTYDESSKYIKIRYLWIPSTSTEFTIRTPLIRHSLREVWNTFCFGFSDILSGYFDSHGAWLGAQRLTSVLE